MSSTLSKKTFIFCYLEIFKVFFASASSFESIGLSSSIQNATLIVQGIVGKDFSDWSKDPEGMIRLYHFYEIQEPQPLKGTLKSSNTILIRELGGTHQGITLQVDGTSQYEFGEKVIVFLKPQNTDGSWDVQGMMMGKYHVSTDEAGQSWIQGVGLVGDNPSADLFVPSQWSLESFKQLIYQQSKPTSDPIHSLTDQKNLQKIEHKMNPLKEHPLDRLKPRQLSSNPTTTAGLSPRWIYWILSFGFAMIGGWLLSFLKS